MTTKMKRTKPTAAQIKAEIAKLTAEEQELLQRLARSTWQYIGPDCLQMNEGKDLPRDEVVELVLDADRLKDTVQQEIRRVKVDPVRRARLEKVLLWLVVPWRSEPKIAPARYAAQETLVGRAFSAREGM